MLIRGDNLLYFYNGGGEDFLKSIQMRKQRANLKLTSSEQLTKWKKTQRTDQCELAGFFLKLFTTL